MLPKKALGTLAVFAVLQLLLLELGAVFIAYFGDSASHELFLIHAALASVSIGLGALAWRRMVQPARAARRGPRLVSLLIVSVLWLAALRWSLALQGPFLNLLVSFLVTGLALLGAHLASRDARWLVTGCPLLFLGVVLFASQLLWPAPRTDLVSWGDDTTFRTMFPLRPPYIHSGGRLGRNLDVHMRSLEEPRGVRLVTNSEGFRNERDVPFAPAPGELRVLSLGDSFSTGMHIDQDEFFGARLERELSSRSAARTVTVLNAEVSDPAFGLYYFQNHGGEYAPRIVVLGLCGNDMSQAEQFCGPGSGTRFVLDDAGRVQENPEFDARDGAYRVFEELTYPREGRRPGARTSGELRRRLWRLRRVGEDLRSYHLVSALLEQVPSRSPPRPMHTYYAEQEARDGHKRLIDFCANVGFFYRREAPPIADMYRRFFELIEVLDENVRAEGARLVVVLYPQRYQVNAEDWRLLEQRWSLAPEDFDLRLYNRRVQEACASRGILCCDLLDAFLGADEQLFLPNGDMHINRAGHRLAARVVAQFLEEEGVLPDPASLEPGSAAFEAAARRADPEPLRPWRFQTTFDEPGDGMARFQEGKMEADERENLERLMLRGGLSAPTEVVYELAGRAQNFRARAWLLDPGLRGEQPCLEIRVDGAIAWSGTIAPGKPSIPIRVDLANARRLELALEARTNARDHGCVVLSNPCFERAAARESLELPVRISESRASATDAPALDR